MSDKNIVIEIKVTPEMVKAGMEELHEHNYGGDLPYMLECVFRAMAYESATFFALRDKRQ